MMRALPRWVRSLVAIAVLAISVYFLFSGSGPYQRIYSSVSFSIIFVLAAVIVFRNLHRYRRVQERRREQNIAGWQAIKALFGCWPCTFSRRWPGVDGDFAPLHGEPRANFYSVSFLIILAGAIISGFNVYLWFVAISRRP